MIVEAIRWGTDTIHRIYLGGEIVWKIGSELSLSHIADLFTNGYHAMQVGDIIVLSPADDAVSVLNGSASVLPTTPIHEEIHSRTDLEGSVFPAVVILCAVDAASMSQAEAEALIAGAVSISKEEGFRTDPAIHSMIAQAVYGSHQSDNGTKTEADMLASPAVYGTHSADNGTTTEASAIIAGTAFVSAGEDNATTSEADMVAADPVPLRATAESLSTSEIDMMTFRMSGVVEIDAERESQSDSDTALDDLDIVNLGGLLRLVTTCEIHLMTAPVAAISAESHSRSDASIILSFEGEPDIPVEPDWYDHVQTGSNLYIRSAWNFWHDGNAGHIDTDVWYEVIQDGSNLYIRSVDSSWQDGKKAYIDLPVFYEPKQNGGNLYIRSADFFWIDGNSANIDTAFFLNPVQEGSNLHIRQNIFGGA